jgi:regulator of cell morphogenesis and NO signaling
METTQKTKEERNESIGKLVAKDYRKASVFKKYGLDFCCGGGKTVAEACVENGLNVDEVEAELKLVEQQDNSHQEDFNSWDLGFLADYIVNKHHKYVQQATQEIYQYTQKVAHVHGHHYTQTIDIAEKFVQLAQELDAHMKKEEQILFPYIKQLEAASKEGKPLERPGFGTVENPVRMMEHEHDIAGNLMREIEVLTEGFDPPKGACMTFRVSYLKLQEFQDDLHRHIHLENNILFPRAIELEKSI